jgi:hypothetical protein
MRIDSSGNLLVGKTAIGNDVGAEFRSIGYSSFTRDSNNVLTVRRKTLDGDIVQFEKDTTVVGKIQSVSGVVSNIILDPRSAVKGSGLRGASSDASEGLLLPIDNAGDLADGTITLGQPSSRFKDLYLSGGVYLGGTGSANKLDDYEEGTWTPTFTQTVTNPTVTYGNTNGFYTKIGRVVHASCRIQASTVSGGSGNLMLDGLPFAASSISGSKDMFTASLGVVFNFSSGNAPSTGFVSPNESRIKLFKADTSDARDNVDTTVTSVGASNGLIMNIVYVTDS